MTRRIGTCLGRSYSRTPWSDRLSSQRAPSREAVVSLAKKAPMAIRERLAAERLGLTGCMSVRENPLAMNWSRDQRSDWVPVSVMADVFTSLVEHDVWDWLCGLSMEMVMDTLGCSLRRSRLHSPLEKMMC